MLAFIKCNAGNVLLWTCLCVLVCVAVGSPTGYNAQPIQITINVNAQRLSSTDSEDAKVKRIEIVVVTDGQVDDDNLVPFVPTSPDGQYVVINASQPINVNEQRLPSTDREGDKVKVIEAVPPDGQVDDDNLVPFVPTSPDRQYDFINAIPPKYHVGHEIIIIGVPLAQSLQGSFFVTMFEGLNSTQKQAMHFNPRFDDREVAINSMTDDLEWSINEQIIDTFPFAANTAFRLSIVLAATEFIFNVNNEPFATMEYYREDLLQLLGGVYISSKDNMQVLVEEFKHIVPTSITNYDVRSSDHYIPAQLLHFKRNVGMYMAPT